jgi:uncharacterized protein (TIGR02266 family)
MSDIILKLGFSAVCFIFIVALIYAISNFFRKRMQASQEGGTAASLIDVTVKEQRQYQRVDIACPVKMLTPQGAIMAQTKNISLGGAFICCQKPLPLGQKFCVTIETPVRQSFTVNAEVIWSNTNVPDERIVTRGMGVRFLQITKDDREILDKIISAGMQKKAK